jgi:nitrite reductase (NADH) small subunit
MGSLREVADSLRPGSCRTVEVAGRRLALVNAGGSFHAIDDACPHRGGALGAGFVDGSKVYCPLHGWDFDVRTGDCGTRPDKPVRTYRTEVRDGRVFVELDAA